MRLRPVAPRAASLSTRSQPDLHLVPRYRKRLGVRAVRAGPLRGAGPPPTANPRYHVRHTAAAKPADARRSSGSPGGSSRAPWTAQPVVGDRGRGLAGEASPWRAKPITRSSRQSPAWTSRRSWRPATEPGADLQPAGLPWPAKQLPRSAKLLRERCASERRCERDGCVGHGAVAEATARRVEIVDGRPASARPR